MSRQEEWWEGFFSGLWLDVQRASKSDEQTGLETDFVEKVLHLASRSSVLDVPCGEGRHAIELAARGYQVTGVDITLPFLSEAQRKAAERELLIAWEHRDMRDLPWESQFDAALCFWGSFGYFDDEGNLAFLNAAARVLRPGGRFLLDTHIAETLLPKLFQERSWRRAGDVLVLEERHYDHVLGRTTTDWTLVRDGRVFEKSTSIRLYTYRELHELLKRSGFVDIEDYGSLNGDPFQLGSPRLYLVATKG